MADLTKKKDAELVKELAEKRAKLREFRFGMSGSKTRNVREGRAFRKQIARILTELSARHKESK